MFLDGQQEYSDAQAVTASAASTNLIDHGTANVDIGTGHNVYLVVTCVTAMTDAASNSTVTVTLQTDTAAAFASATTALTLTAFAAESAAGTRRVAKLDPGAVVERFTRCYYTVAGGNLTTGSFDAQLTLEAPDAATKEYPNNYTIS
jgi:hypothetical protein